MGKNNLPLFFSMLFCLLIGSKICAHDLTKVNFSYLYNHDPVKIDHQIAKQDSLYKLVLTFHLVKVLPADKLDGFELSQQKKINSAKENLITPLKIKVDSGFIKNTIELDFYAQPENNYVVVTFLFLGKQYYYGIPINAALAFPLSDMIYRTDAEAMFYNGFKESDSVWIDNISGSNVGYFAFEYAENFNPALPPMIVDEGPSSPKLEIAAIESFPKGLTLNQSDYIYFIQNDTTSNEGITILSHASYYPRVKKVDDLINTLIYICTGDEYEEMQEAEDKKMAFNDFWLNHIDDKKTASETIKKYFRSVKFANALFTDYKKGWKTDRGMIYIAFGPPEKVTKKEDEEIWEYETFNGDLKLTFAKTPNLFVQHHYTLEREKILNNVWFKAVQKWRTGD